MAVITVSSAGRRALETIVARPRESRPYRRAQALLWLAEGERPTAVAQRLRVHAIPSMSGPSVTEHGGLSESRHACWIAHVPAVRGNWPRRSRGAS